jgi:hypothetical protein
MVPWAKNYEKQVKNNRLFFGTSDGTPSPEAVDKFVSEMPEFWA